VLVVDEPSPHIDYRRERFKTVFARDLGFEHFEHMAFRYSILELSTAVKPKFLKAVHALTGCPALCYFDPDIVVYDELSPLYAELAAADVVLTPHITRPIEDRATPGERDFLLSGMYNLGFVGVSLNERTLPFLDWWGRRLHRECLHAVERGLFVDQRWMDFTPALLERTRILRQPGYNVAYWNLPERALEYRAERWWVNGEPLRFFHFSGFLYDEPQRLSRYQDRYGAGERADIAPLFAEYQKRLTAAEHPRFHPLPYSYGSFDNGVRVPDLARRLLREADPEALRWKQPFQTDPPDDFLTWLGQSRDGDARPPIPRIGWALWDSRPDVQQVFREPTRQDRLGFARWLLANAEPSGIAGYFLRELGGALDAERPEGAEATKPRQEEQLRAPESELSWETDSPFDPSTPGVTRLALRLHAARPDLQRAFPEPLGASRVAFLRWLVTFGRAEYSVPRAWIVQAARSLAPRERLRAHLWWAWNRAVRRYGGQADLPQADLETVGPTTLQPTPLEGPLAALGLNVIGWPQAPTGIGEACRGSLLAAGRAGLPTSVWALGNTGRPIRQDSGLPYDVSLFHVNADMMPIVLHEIPFGLTAGRYQIGYWFWELSYFPLSFGRSFNGLDEVWAPTRFCENAFRSISPVPVRHVPPCVAQVDPRPVDRGTWSIPGDAFVFFFSFDVLSVTARKNPWAAIAAFERLRTRTDRRIHLVLKINHAETEAALAQELEHRLKGQPTTIVRRQLSRDEVLDLTAATDCYLALHRSEGLGLPLIEAMQLGKPVVATEYGGVTDFFDRTTGYPVPYRLVPLEESHGPYPVGAVWAEPDIDAAVDCMLEAMHDDAERQRRGAAARDRVRSLYHPEVAAARLREELHRVQQILRAR
jgi:glycosyltransferase involved in cell wall biosynthesis